MQGEGAAAGQAATGRAGFWTIAGVACVLIGPPLLMTGPMQHVFALAGSDDGAIFVGQMFLWLILAVALACLVLGEGLPLASVSLVAPRVRSILFGLVIGCAVYAALFAMIVALAKLELFDVSAAAAAIPSWPLWLRIFAVVTAGVVEEALYRGYAIERLTALVGRRWLAALIALAAFAMAHVPFWGVGALATPLIGGGFFTLIYLWRRDLVACMVAHSAIDFVGMVIAPMLNSGT